MGQTSGLPLGPGFPLPSIGICRLLGFAANCEARSELRSAVSDAIPASQSPKEAAPVLCPTGAANPRMALV